MTRTATIPPRPKGRQGFASMDKAMRREIARKGGIAAHAKGFANEFNSAEGSAAAKIGHARGTAHEFDSAEARIAGRKGGLVRAAKRARRRWPPPTPENPLDKSAKWILTVKAEGPGPPVYCRLKRFLKHLLRTHGIRVLDIRQIEPKERKQ